MVITLLEKRVINDESKQAMRELLKEIQDGRFKKRLYLRRSSWIPKNERWEKKILELR